MDEPHEHAKPTASLRTAALVLVAIFVAIGFFGWQTLQTRRLTISSVSKPGEYRLPGRPPRSTKLHVHVTGWLEGQATLTIPGQEAATIGPSNVDWTWSGAWTEPDGLLKYAPKTATMGSLQVEYRFD